MNQPFTPSPPQRPAVDLPEAELRMQAKRFTDYLVHCNGVRDTLIFTTADGLPDISRAMCMRERLAGFMRVLPNVFRAERVGHVVRISFDFSRMYVNGTDSTDRESQPNWGTDADD